MRARSRVVAVSALAAFAALAACQTTPGGPPAEITRFHVPQPIARGAVSIVPLSGDPSDLEFQSYAAAVAPALQAAGFTVAPPAAMADLTLSLDVRRTTFATPPRGPAFSIGIGGASFGRHSGFGADTGVGFGPRAGTAVGTEITMQLRRRSDGANLWEGRGRTSAPIGTPAAEPAAAVGRLAGALFNDFPGQSGQTVTLK